MALAQQSSGLQYLQTVGIPGWKATGAAGNANTDLMGYNPVTRMMYLADRTNNGIDVIDTQAHWEPTRMEPRTTPSTRPFTS